MIDINYFERRDKINKLFGNDFYERYPLASRIMDRYIRSKLHYNDRESEIIKSEYQHDKGLMGLIKTLVYFSLFRFRQTRSNNIQEKILVSPLIFGRFEMLGKQLKEKYNISSVFNKRAVLRVLKAGVKDTIETDKMIYNKKLQRLLPESGVLITKFIDNSNDFNKRILFQKLDILENVLNREITKLSKIFKDKKIKLYISAFDQIYDDTFNILACQKAGIKTKCIAHAYLAGGIEYEPKSACLPVFADKLYVWSQEDYDLLKGYEEMEKIEVGGYPKFTKEYIEKKKKEYPAKKIITFFSGWRFSDQWMRIGQGIRKRLFKVFKEIAEKQGYEIYIRYQSNREKKMRKKERGLLKKCHIKISKNPFLKDVLQSEICLAFDTSCLYEAKVLGKRVYTLFTHSKYDKIFFMKNIEYINPDDIKEKVKQRIRPKPRYDLLMDLDYIIKKI